jgi:hypothetical protein
MPVKRFLSMALVCLAVICQSFVLLNLSPLLRDALVLEGMLLACVGLASYARTCQRHRLWGVLGLVPIAGVPLALSSLMLLDWFDRRGRLETAPRYVQFANTVLKV